ncbi:MAG: hypothetical protein IPI90_12785 [Saprospiraceae bacterium]|nr:hypothetical protein [Candidatus Vicinibacter affinis]
MESPNEQLSESLLELSDSLERLANTWLKQKEADMHVQVKEFSVLVNKFQKTVKGALPDQRDEAAIIKAKHKKNFIISWLKAINVQAVDYANTLKAQTYLIDTADYLAHNFEHLKEFYTTLKYQQNLKRDFKFKTARSSLGYIKQWCTMLSKNKLLDKFSEDRSNNLEIEIAEIHDATMFIYGHWLEILLRSKLASLLHKNLDRLESFDLLSQVVILKPDGTNSELDLLLMINERVYWFECKSGVIKDYFEKFKEHKNLLKLPQEQSFVVVPEKDPNIAIHVRKRSEMTCLNSTELELQLEQHIFDQNLIGK